MVHEGIRVADFAIRSLYGEERPICRGRVHEKVRAASSRLIVIAYRWAKWCIHFDST